MCYSSDSLKKSLVDYVLLNILKDNYKSGISYQGLFTKMSSLGLFLGRTVVEESSFASYEKWFNSSKEKEYLRYRTDRGSVEITDTGKSYLDSLEKDISFIKNIFIECKNTYSVREDKVGYILDNSLPLFFVRVGDADSMYKAIEEGYFQFARRGLNIGRDDEAECNVIFTSRKRIVCVIKGIYVKDTKVLNILESESIKGILDLSEIEDIVRINCRITKVSDDIKRKIAERV